MGIAKNPNPNKDFIEALKIGRFRGDKNFQDMVSFFGILEKLVYPREKITDVFSIWNRKIIFRIRKNVFFYS